ncbi:MAG: hypothetical protein PHD40_08215 [Syntrophomonadaceae bacterium]|nr:hypothetical protein [Syntrophomonadaceae bacterium]
MKNNIDLYLSELNRIAYDILDPNFAMGDAPNNYTESSMFSDVPLSDDDLDIFDTISWTMNLNPVVEPQAPTTKTSMLDFASLEQACRVALNSGDFWGADDMDLNIPGTLDADFESAINHLTEECFPLSEEDLLAQFDNWSGTPMDILSFYGDVDYGHNIYEEGFEMDLPIRIFSSNEDVIVKASVPWVKVDSFEAMDIYSNNINLKSVLSLLPVRVNSREMKVSFIDGEFKLEMPRIEEKETKLGKLQY